MVDYTVVYEESGETEYEDMECFGSLKDLSGRVGFDVEVGDRVLTIDYYVPFVKGFRLKLKDWLEAHPLFSIPLLNISTGTNGCVVIVDAAHPADLVMATLSMARSLLDDNRVGLQKDIEKYYNEIGDLDLAIYLAEFGLHSAEEQKMFVYKEESLVPDFTIKEFMTFLANPLCNGKGVEQDYDTYMEYGSVKTALTGKSFTAYNYHKRDSAFNRPQLLSFLKYEGLDYATS